jgi:hypothetical protein
MDPVLLGPLPIAKGGPIGTEIQDNAEQVQVFGGRAS